ncbi:hypothetical protein V8E54_015036 [Elaphomyces granulatus]
MMEPIEVISSIIVLTDVAIKATNIARLVRNTKDPQTDAIVARFYTEQAKLEEWQRRMHISTTADLVRVASQLDSKPQTKMIRIYIDLQIWMQKADAMLKGFGLDPESVSRNQSFRSYCQRLKWTIVGLQELDGLLMTLHHLNEGLSTITPPPPGYYISRNMETTGAGVTSPQSNVSGSSPPRTDGTQLQSSVPAEIGEERGTFQPTIRALFHSCLQTLRLLSSKGDEKGWARTINELQLWGTGLFEDPLPLDNLLSLKRLEALRSHILGILADIGVTVEYAQESLGISNEISETVPGSNLSVLLGLAEIADAAHDDPQLLNGPKSEGDLEEYLKECQNEIIDLIGCLFETLPMLQKLRHAEYLKVLDSPSADETQTSEVAEQIDAGPIVRLAVLNEQLMSSAVEDLRNYAKCKETEQITMDLSEKIREYHKWKSSSAKRMDAHCSAEKNTSLNRAAQVSLTRIARAFEIAFPQRKHRGNLSQEEIQRRILECHSLLGEADELDFKDTPIGGPSDAVKVLGSALETLQQLSVAVRLSASSVVKIDTSEAVSAKKQEAAAEASGRAGYFVAV